MVENERSISKAISKSELAERYGVNAVTLRNWINGNEQLLTELKKIGYKKNVRILRPKELDLIEQYIGF